ncbi:futalosine hydrolase [Mucilaginibacter sp. UR6-1]|uniref:futalosine hydrolase n=1 Tax=Mucilaginibacter sp. UR6-1 TaxID=1435643 RepID=UPI001E54506A|nr:futalosine hydrolase [Mucilaginibacter sp. UR6-1]MCC8410741.1 futalosine hydrolase [Mucilaginibacter sp. UR6-1]
MHVLIVAATQPEVGGLISDFGFSIADSDNNQLLTANRPLQTINNCKLLITGAGMVATAFALGRHLATNTYDLVINLGIAGSFDHGIALGTVCEVTEDTLVELGAEDDETFITIDELGFGESRFKATYNLPSSAHIKKVIAATVNTVHGNEASIQKLSSRVNAQLESMEGAAFFYACEQAGVPCVQIRSVSNYVEKRNRAAWQIGLAIKNLNTFAAELLRNLLKS